MAILPRQRQKQKQQQIDLRNGDHFTQPEFHRLYEQMPENFKAELLNGTVFVREPLGLPHGCHHLSLGALFLAYAAATTGVQAADNVTVMLGEEDEVQPDLLLRVLPRFRGQSQDTRKGRYGRYVKGAPELVAEIALSSHSIDLHLKKQRYASAGVIEYIVLCLEPEEIQWFDLRANGIIKPNSQDILCSSKFPGLWVDRKALLRNDYDGSMKALQRGLNSPEHANFVAHLKEIGF
jgi:Uma2 family endonuclease